MELQDYVQPVWSNNGQVRPFKAVMRTDKLLPVNVSYLLLLLVDVRPLDSVDHGFESL
jgi:hypothetical protein